MPEPASPTKDQAIDLLEVIARLLELKGENPFKIRAYRTAASSLETFSGDLAKTAAEGKLGEIDGIGDALAAKLTEYFTEGRIRYAEELREEFPADILTLFELPGLGAKKIKALHDQLGISSITRLERACHDGSVAALAGFGEKTAANILKSIEYHRKNAGSFHLDVAMRAALRIEAYLREHPAVSRASVAGSCRRRKEIVHDLDFLVASPEPAQVMEAFLAWPGVEEVLARGETKSSVRIHDGLQCDLRVVSNAEYPFALCYFTGSKEHNVRLRARAQKMGWTLNEYRLAPAAPGNEAPPQIYDEAGLYRALGLDFIEPELREDAGEIDAAERGALPRLIEPENLRGTFHCHTNESDGRNTLEEMAAAAHDLGLQYLGIADHSKSSFQAGGMSEERILAQAARIRELNRTYDDFRLFAGVECDILKDGSLDFSDEVLAQLDYVVASVHASLTLPQAEMTRRIIRAMENPHVTFLGHLTGRLLLSREPYAVDIPAIIEAAAATGTVIELNANPRRLDMDWRWWRLAKEKGVRCAINPDAHRVEGLQHLWFGVAIARKGWLTREDVVNCLPLGKIEAELGRKRSLHAGG